MKKQLVRFLFLGATSLLLAGCVAAIGNRDGRYSGGTVGQQLIDLQKAKDAGVISETEFQQQRQRLLNN